MHALAAGATDVDRFPWLSLLSAPDVQRLRGDLQLVLDEPDATGEPLDWNEVLDILQEFAASAG